MRIVLTGSSGGLGSLLLKELRNNHEMITLGRHNCDIPWSLGVIPSPEELKEVDAFIHCAWSTKDRRDDFHLNVGGTGTLARFVEANNIPFLFISSVAADSNSYYGNAKYEAEVSVRRHQGSILRLGLVPQSNPYLSTKKRFLGISPSFQGAINVTEFGELQASVEKWLGDVQNGHRRTEQITAVTKTIPAKDYFASHYKVAIPIPISILRLALNTFGLINRKYSNLLDALNSLASTPGINP